MSIQRIGLSTAIALAVGGSVALGGSANLLSLLTQAIIYAVFAIGIGLLLRQNGMVSFGHALFFGSAGYFIGILLQLNTMPAEAAILVTLLALTLMAFVMGLVIVRVPGIAFGMLTLAIGQMFYLTASRSRGLTGGADGMSIEWPATLFGVSMSKLVKPDMMFLICWVTLVVVLLLLSAVSVPLPSAMVPPVPDSAPTVWAWPLRSHAPPLTVRRPRENSEPPAPSCKVPALTVVPPL